MENNKKRKVTKPADEQAKKASKPASKSPQPKANKAGRAGKALMKPIAWAYTQYPKKYMSLGSGYSVGSITKNNMDHYKTHTIKQNSDFKLKRVIRRLMAIPTDFSKARKRYEDKAKRIGMTYENRESQNDLGLILQLFSIILLVTAYCYSLDNNFRDPNGEELIIINNGINVIILQLSTWMAGLNYLVFTWRRFSARNRMQLNPFHFAYLMLIHPLELLPMPYKLEDTLETIYDYKI
jgi:ribosomal protein L13E